MQGESGTLTGGTVKAWADVNGSNEVVRVGVTIPDATLNGGMADGGTPFADLALDFPSVVQSTTFFQHVNAGWLLGGHEPPGLFDVAHYDVHFYGVTKAGSAAIDCSDVTLPDSNEFPAGYGLPPFPPDAGPAVICVPTMGQHAISGAVFANGYMFSAEQIYGYYAGALVFIEPMVTHAKLMAHENFTLPVPLPESVAAGRYPTSFAATYSSTNMEWELVFETFVTR